MFLPPSPLPKAVPAVGRFRLPLTPFSLRFCHTHRGRHGLRRSAGCSDAHRTADLSIPEFYTGDGPRRDRFDCVRLRLAWHSSPSVVDDAPTNSDSNGYCTPAVYYGFEPGGALRPSSRRDTTPPRVPRPRPAPPAAATPAVADSPVRMVPLPSDRDYAEPIWELLSYGSRLLLVTRRLHIQGRTPSATLLNCGSLIPPRVIHMPIESDSSTLRRRATP